MKLDSELQFVFEEPIVTELNINCAQKLFDQINGVEFAVPYVKCTNDVSVTQKLICE